MSHSKRTPLEGRSRRCASTPTVASLDQPARNLLTAVALGQGGEWPDSSDSPTMEGVAGCEFGFLEADGAPWPGSESGETLDAAALPFVAPSGSTPRPRPTSASLRRAELVGAATIDLGRSGPGSLAARAEGARFPKLAPESPPVALGRPARGAVTLPGPGDEFLGFRIIEELGRGTFGRVFLAQQGELAQRPVALKVTTEVPNESRTLAQLQHTNIVPIFSVHHTPTLHAVCMPYFGRATLADLLDDLMGQESLPSSGLAVAKVIESRQSRRMSGEPGSSAGRSGLQGGSDPAARPASSLPTSLSVAATPTASSSEVLREIGHLSYVNAVLWIVARIAAGLAHAHKRGILHRDLKPANVLMTDDGQPMILDFNLSEDTKDSGSPTTLGGTLRYMSPEHLDGFMGCEVTVDVRSDLFALGVMLFELLTGQSPFPTYPGCSLTVLKRMREDRQNEIPRAGQLNPAVTPAIEAIIRACLDPDPRRRYATADQVMEDIDRHLADLPLRHLPEPSARERAQKWLRRHPRLGSITTVAVLTGCLLLGLTALLVARGQKLAQFEAARELERFRDDTTNVRFLLSHRDDPDQQRKGEALAKAALGRYGVLDDPRWPERPAITHLVPEAANQLRSEVAEVLLMMSQVTLIQADQGQDAGARVDLARSARRLNQIALGALPEGARPQALEAQKAALARILDGEAEGARLAAEADKLPLVTARDYYLAAAAKAMRGEFGPAVPLAEEATRLDPQHFWAYFILGVCHENLGADAEATACFTTCTALRPDFADSWLYRGLSYLKRDDYNRARADFDRAGRLRPTWAEPYQKRALAYRNLGDHLKAHNDLTRALELGGPPAKVLLLRSAERRALGDKVGAEEDLAEGLKHEPTDVLTWVCRGMARLQSDAPGALADFESALKIDPNDLEALQYSAYMLSNLPNRQEDAIRMLDRCVAAHPDYAPAWSGRGVLLAILGRRDEAHRDAREALWRDTRPMIQYQVAGIYATTSKTHPEDRAEAYRLLASALRAGFGFDMIDQDRELDPIRDQPEFQALVASARGQATTRLQRGLGR